MANFQKRHYEVFAKVVRDMQERMFHHSDRVKRYGQGDSYCSCDAWLENELVIIFSEDNPNFDSAKFRKESML